MAATRACRWCGEEKPHTLEFFPAHPQCAGGIDTRCRRCAQEASVRWRERNRERSRASARAQLRRVREEALRAYGGKHPACACCGEDTYEFLAIDHVGGGGNEERRRLGLSGSRFTAWLKREGFPSGYRVLCHNCNAAIGHFGSCPHEHNVVSLALAEAP